MYKDLLGKEARTLIYCADVTITYNNIKSPTSQSDFFFGKVSNETLPRLMKISIAYLNFKNNQPKKHES